MSNPKIGKDSLRIIVYGFILSGEATWNLKTNKKLYNYKHNLKILSLKN